MVDYVTLMGAEQVQSAGRTIAAAAEELRRAGGNIDEAARVIDRAAATFSEAVTRHTEYLDGWLAKLEEIIVVGNQKRVAGDRVEWLLERHAELMYNDGLGPVQDVEAIKSILAIEDELAARGRPLEHSKTHTGSINEATRSAR